MVSGIYAITNTVTREQYIGASGDIHARWQMHRTSLRWNQHNRKLQLAWREYGEDAFIFEIIEEVEGQEYLIEREQFHMRQRFNRTGNHGYNVRPEPGCGFKKADSRDASASTPTGNDTPDDRVRLNLYLTSQTYRMMQEMAPDLYSYKRPWALLFEDAVREKYERWRKGQKR